MRITNKMLANNFLSDMQVNLDNLKTLQEQSTSGKNFKKPSDDPFNVARSMQMHSAINTNKQYNKNIVNVGNWLDTTDTALGQMGNVYQSMREKLIASGNAAYGSDERKKIKDEINQKIDQISQILNTNFDGEYIFGGTKGASKPVKTVKESDGNMTLMYTDASGNEIKTIPPVISKGFDIGNWSEKNVKFSVNGTDIANSIQLSKFDSSKANIDTVIKDLNDKINQYSEGTPSEFVLRGKIDVSKTEDGKIKFLSLTNDAVNISSTDINDIDPTDVGKQFSSSDMDKIASKRKTEISQGVMVEYNVSANEVIKYGDGEDDDLRGLLERITKHLDGKIEKRDPATGKVEKGADGKVVYIDDEKAATHALTNEDIKDVDSAMAKLLKVRSEVGAKENRMDSAKDQNLQSNFDMKEILSKTEDIDITEKTIEFATMVTVYMASLQTSARVMQPTLMDYIR